MLSVIIPAYNEEENILPLAGRLKSVLSGEGIAYELLFVDDGSKDRTFSQITLAAGENPCVRGLSFTRNFGKEPAVFAGLKAARGDCMAVIDSDLQQPPETLVEMYRLWEKGVEIVEGVKKSRGDEGTSGGIFAKIFYKLICSLTGFDMSSSSDFKLIDRRVAEILLSLPEKSTFFRGLTFWTGFSMEKVEYDVAPRLHGKSKWSFRSLMRYAVSNITNFSSAPLNLIGIVGGGMILFGFIMAVIALVQYFAGTAVAGFTTVILLQVIFTGAILIALGVIGYYTGKIYDEVKGRPRYIVRRETPDQMKG